MSSIAVSPGVVAGDNAYGPLVPSGRVTAQVPLVRGSQTSSGCSPTEVSKECMYMSIHCKLKRGSCLIFLLLILTIIVL